MESIYLALLVFQVVVAFGLVGVILLQHGKGADAGAAFGSATSTSVFGSQGAGNFLTKITSMLAFLFLASSLCLGYIATQQIEQSLGVMEEQSVMSEGTMSIGNSDIPSNTSAHDIPEISEE